MAPSIPNRPALCGCGNPTHSPLIDCPPGREALAALLGEAKPASDHLLASLAEAVSDRREHEHPTWEDIFCGNLAGWLGERMGPVLRRLLDAEARVAELEAHLAAEPRATDGAVDALSRAIETARNTNGGA